MNLQLDKAAAAAGVHWSSLLKDTGVHWSSLLKDSRKGIDRFCTVIIDVVVLLAQTSHPLRGHREGSDSHNRGLFREITSLLAQYDPVLKDHFQNSPKNAAYTSMGIQNEIFFCYPQSLGMKLNKVLTMAGLLQRPVD